MTGHTTFIECFREGAGQEHLREGWSEIIEDTWTIGHRASVELPPPVRGSDYSLTLEINGIAGPPEGAVQRLILSINNVRIADAVCRGAQRLEFCVPASVLQPGETVKVAFDLPFACRPSDFGHNNDSRLLALRMRRIAFAPLAPAAASHGTAAEIARQGYRAVLLDLCSLGVNCEVGFLQRKMGAEPLGLFRWTSAPLPKVTRALEQGFVGLGAPDSLHIQMDAQSEFIVRDTVYGFQYHSFVFANRGGTLEQVSLNEYSRLRYLSRTLLEDLRAGKKLFSYHDGGKSGLEDIRRLLRAMNQLGPNTLLWIVPTPPGTEVSTARLLEPGLIQAFVSGFQMPIDQVLPTSPYQDSWLKAISQGHHIWQVERGLLQPETSDRIFVN